MNVVLLSKKDALAKGIPYTSPTSVSGWLECQRKWAYRYLAKMYAPPTASADLGTDAHKQLELYLTEGKALDFTRPSGEILQAGLHLFPAPKTPGLVGEGEFYFLSERTGFLYMGKKDAELPPGVPQPQLEFDGSAPIVLDLKTTGSIADYAKSGDTLLFDPQSGMYAIDAMTRYASSSADLGWIYCQTKGAKKSKPVTFRMGEAHAQKLLDAIESVAEEMHVAREASKAHLQHKPTPLVAQPPATIDFVRSLPPNPSACRAFGGCPYQSICNLSPSQKARASMSDNSLIASLRNRVQGTNPSVETKKEEPKAPPSIVETLTSPEQTEIPEALTKPYQPKSAEGAAFLGLPPPTNGPSADPINPPESLLPPAPLPEKNSAEDEKPKKQTRTRAKKDAPAPEPPKQIELPGTDVVTSNGANKASASGAVDVASKEEIDRVLAALTGFTLFVDCMPDGCGVVYADELVEQANDIIVERQKTTNEPVQHYKFLQFGKAAGALDLALGEVLDAREKELERVFCTSGSDALAALTKRASHIIRSVR